MMMNGDCDDNKNVCQAACVHKNQSNCDKFSRLITNCSKILNFFVPAKYCNQFIGFGKTNNPVGG